MADVGVADAAVEVEDVCVETGGLRPKKVVGIGGVGADAGADVPLPVPVERDPSCCFDACVVGGGGSNILGMVLSRLGVVC